jgi:anti-sigma regulatory factor (Ser/Thr protein kinase)
VRGVCEAVRPRHSAAVPDCQRHEQLLNVAFNQAPRQFRLLCPYDMRRACADTLSVARRTHPHVWTDGRLTPSHDFAALADPLHHAPLSRTPDHAAHIHFDVHSLHDTRERVSEIALHSGVTEDSAVAIVLAVNELTSNSIRYGGGSGSLTIWCEEDAFICEVRDGGTITDPLVGCIRPSPYQERGRGLWMVNQICDHVQLHSSPAGTVVRTSVRRDPGTACACY